MRAAVETFLLSDIYMQLRQRTSFACMSTMIGMTM